MAEAVHRTDAFARPLAFRVYLAATNVLGASVLGYALARVISDIGVGHLRGSGNDQQQPSYEAEEPPTRWFFLPKVRFVIHSSAK